MRQIAPLIYVIFVISTIQCYKNSDAGGEDLKVWLVAENDVINKDVKVGFAAVKEEKDIETESVVNKIYKGRTFQSISPCADATCCYNDSFCRSDLIESSEIICPESMILCGDICCSALLRCDEVSGLCLHHYYDYDYLVDIPPEFEIHPVIIDFDCRGMGFD